MEALVGTILGKVISTIILVFVIGTILGIFTYLGDKTEEYGMKNFLYSYLVIGGMALIIWLIRISIFLMS